MWDCHTQYHCQHPWTRRSVPTTVSTSCWTSFCPECQPANTYGLPSTTTYEIGWLLLWSHYVNPLVIQFFCTMWCSTVTCNICYNHMSSTMALSINIQSSWSPVMFHNQVLVLILLWSWPTVPNCLCNCNTQPSPYLPLLTWLILSCSDQYDRLQSSSSLQPTLDVSINTSTNTMSTLSNTAFSYTPAATSWPCSTT